MLVSGLCIRKKARKTPVLGGGGLILALPTTESVTVPISTVLWLGDEGTN
jgi:hypothetical protein